MPLLLASIARPVIFTMERSRAEAALNESSDAPGPGATVSVEPLGVASGVGVAEGDVSGTGTVLLSPVGVAGFSGVLVAGSGVFSGEGEGDADSPVAGAGVSDVTGVVLMLLSEANWPSFSFSPSREPLIFR